MIPVSSSSFNYGSGVVVWADDVTVTSANGVSCPVRLYTVGIKTERWVEIGATTCAGEMLRMVSKAKQVAA